MKHTVLKFPEWLPDMPDLDSPGLTEANDCLPVDTSYKPYLPISPTGTAMASRPYGSAALLDSSGVAYVFAGESTNISMRETAGWTLKGRATAYALTSSDYWRWTQFDDFAIATSYSDLPQVLSLGTTGSFGDLSGSMGTAPSARQVGVINRFVVMGDVVEPSGTTTPHRIMWSGLDNHDQWPLPGSSTAASVQSGAQTFDANYKEVTGIANGEQVGLVFQRGAIHRLSYIGGSTVFQIDTIERARGCICPNALVQVGPVSYFPSADGFYATDGVNIRSIGADKVDNYWLDDIDEDYLYRVYGAVDFQNQNIYWAYPGSGNTSGRPNKILVYNYRDGRWSNCDQETEGIFSGLTFAVSLDALDSYFASIDLTTPSLDSSNWKGGQNVMLGFDSSYVLGGFSGSAGTTVIETAEVQLTPGARTYISGVKPQIQYDGESPTVTVQVGYRESLASSVTWTSATSVTSRSRTADFRVDTRYAKIRLNIAGAYTFAQGVEVYFNDSGGV